jgi:hypothetical protein
MLQDCTRHKNLKSPAIADFSAISRLFWRRQRDLKYKEMAEDELKHAHYVREMISFDMECFNKNVTENKRMLE